MLPPAMTPVLRFTRAVFVTGFCLTIATGIGLYAVPDRTADYWAWTIKSPLTAAFFGAGYISAAFALGLAARAPCWERARIVAVAAFSLTSLALVATLLEPDTFAFGDGGLPEAVAWFWLAVYVALPPAVMVAFVRQERLAGSVPAEPEALWASRIASAAVGVVLAALGIGLFADWAWLASRWPWPLPALPARVLGAWLCTYAAILLWFALRERSWTRARIAVVSAIVALGLDLGAAARFSGDLDGDTSTTVYLAGTSGLLVMLFGIWWLEESRLGSRGATVRA
jgi:hypothetical protein